MSERPAPEPVRGLLNYTRASWRDYAEHHLQQYLEPGATALGQTPDVRVDAETLLQHVLECTRSSLYAWPEKVLEPRQIDTLETLLNRRAQGEPLAYLLGRVEFHAREFLINPDVLVPRDDTEALVNLALEFLHCWPGTLHAVELHAKEHADLHADLNADLHARRPVILDIGTGSGAIAITVAAESGAHVIATDLSPAALKLSSMNADRHVPGQITFLQADWLSAFADNSANMILSNPPYIAEDDPHLARLSHEPELALVSGRRGLDAIEQIIHEAVRVGVPDCPLILEHGYQQGPAVRALMQQAGLKSIRTEFDLAGHERVTLGHVAN